MWDIKDVMYAKTLLFLLLLGFAATPVLAHWEDPQGCNKMVQTIPKLDAMTSVYKGISEDKRDYIFEWQQTDGPIHITEHHILLPPAQWKDPKDPEYFEPILSFWIDWDGSGQAEEFWVFPRGNANCDDALHFIWDGERQTYLLVQSGKDHI